MKVSTSLNQPPADQPSPAKVRYLSRTSLAETIGVHPRTVDAMRKRGQIPFIALSRKLILFDPVAVEAALKRYEVNPGLN